MQSGGQSALQSQAQAEILLTSMDADGTKNGYDLRLTEEISKRCSVPVIASGGCGHADHIIEVFQKTAVDAH